MPLYEYLCRACGRKAELLVRNGRQKPACPACGSKRMVRQFSTFAAHRGGDSGLTCPSADFCPSGSCPRKVGR